METDVGFVRPEVEQPRPQPKPLGAWATIGLGAVVFIIYSLVQGITLFAVYLISIISLPNQADAGIDQITNSMITNGLALSVSIIVAAPVGILLIVVFIRLRKGISLSEYLGLRPLRGKTFPALLAIPVVLVIIVELIGMFFIKGNDSGFMVEAYQNSTWPALFWIATVIFAPAFEEALFRGFAFTGLRYSPMGATGAVVLTSLVWALLHIQYDWFGMGTILVIGIILGIVRIKTGSLWGTILIHSTWNLLQMIGIVLFVAGIVK